MARTYNVSSTHEAKKAILKIIMGEVIKMAGHNPVKINIKSDKNE